MCTEQNCASSDKLKNQKSKDKKSNYDNCVNKHVENRFVQMNEHLDTPFASPAIYEHFEDFKNIKMNLITTHICPLLDDSIEMYKRWPGAKKINIFDNLPHGFIQFVDLSPSCKKASNQIVQIINTTIDDRLHELNGDNNNNNDSDKPNENAINNKIDPNNKDTNDKL